MPNYSAQITDANIVVCILHDSKGRVPDGNIPFLVDDPQLVLGTKYDPNAETTEIKSMKSFTQPSENKYFDNQGNEIDL